MTELRWNPNNTEGAWPVSYDFIDTELRKGEKIVATDLDPDLYDVLITNVQDEEILLFDGGIQKWVNGAAGGGCSIIDIDTEYMVGESGGEEAPGGGEQGDFLDFKDAFDWLRENCMVISEDATVTLTLLSSLSMTLPFSFNHPYGHRIEINLGNNTFTLELRLPMNNRLTFLQEDAVSISGGSSFSALVRADGTLRSTGDNPYYQLAMGNTTTDRNEFNEEGQHFTDWVKVFCGDYHSAGIRSDGSLWAVGRNNYGQLGQGDYDQEGYFRQIGSATNWVNVVCGQYTTTALNSDGEIWSCGRNNYGQLGIGNTTTSINNLTQESSLSTDWAMISAFASNTMAIKTNGALYGTGYNYYGGLGIGTSGSSANVNVFTRESNAWTDWVDVSAGLDGSCGIRDNGGNRTLWSCGRNLRGELGIGTQDSSVHPNFVQENGLAVDWDKCASGFYLHVALKTDGTIWGAGYNTLGQLGNGSTDSYVYIQEDTDATDWVDIAAGNYHVFGIKTDGNAYCTGNNGYGQLGLNVTGGQRYSYVPCGYNGFQIYINKDDVSESNNMWQLQNHSLKRIYNGNISFYLNLQSGSPEEDCPDLPDNYPLYGFNIIDNSSVEFDNINLSKTINYSGTTFNIYTLRLKNNSYIHYGGDHDSYSNQDYCIIENGSVFGAETYPYNLYVKNSTVLHYPDIPDYDLFLDNSTFINSKLIEYK